MQDISRLIVPPLDPEPWPSLGFEVIDHIETGLCHGPGDLLGAPIHLSNEYRLFYIRAYEVWPDPRHPAFDALLSAATKRTEREELREHLIAQVGRRRFKRVVLSRRKGAAKTEIQALTGLCELDPDAPVRCDGWHTVGGEWVPAGRGVHDAYIPMVAVTEEQTEDLAYRGAYEIALRCLIADRFDPALERIGLRDAPGKITALASAPSARDGARTTFQGVDEPHLWYSDRLKRAHATMLRNIPKRFAADAWTLETTTMFGPGEGSVAEESWEYALAISRGELANPSLYFDHRQAREVWDLRRDGDLREAIREASGDAWEWTDVEGVVSLFHDPATDENEFRRYWLNQRRKSSQSWIQSRVLEALVSDRPRPEAGTECVFAFDGAYSRDATGLVGCTVEEFPHVWVQGVWEPPPGATLNWRVNHTEVHAAVDAAMREFRVLELAPDPWGWHQDVEQWEEKYGEVVVRFETNRTALFAPACDDFLQGAVDGLFTIERSEPLFRHLSNAVAKEQHGKVVAAKSAPDSRDLIDLADAAIVAYHRARWHWIHRQRPRAPRLIDLGE